MAQKPTIEQHLELAQSLRSLDTALISGHIALSRFYPRAAKYITRARLAVKDLRTFLARQAVQEYPDNAEELRQAYISDGNEA